MAALAANPVSYEYSHNFKSCLLITGELKAKDALHIARLRSNSSLFAPCCYDGAIMASRSRLASTLGHHDVHGLQG